MKKWYTLIFVASSVVLTSLMILSCAGNPAPIISETHIQTEKAADNKINPAVMEVLHLYEEAVSARNPDLLRELLCRKLRSGSQTDPVNGPISAALRLLLNSG